MSDRPWLENGDPSLRVERDLLRRLNAQEPPAGSVDHGWAALAAEIPALQGLDAAARVPAPTHGIPHVAAGGGAVGLAAKIVVGVALGGAALWTSNALLKPSDVGPVAPNAQHAHATPPSTPVGEAIGSAPPPPSDAPAAATDTNVPAPLVPRPVSSASTLVEEGRLLAKAHDLVQAGQGRQALEVLRLSQARYPRSALYQEREVLTIEALGVSGASSAAKQRAERFLKRYPNSPHAGSLQRFVE